ncbi:hypothetical protein Tco_1518474, partial [Tanacetum coccineum]
NASELFIPLRPYLEVLQIGIRTKVIENQHRDPLAWAVDFFRLQEPDLPEAAPASPDYVPGPKDLEQAPLSPNYVLGPEYLEYLALSDEEVPVEDQPYVLVDSPIALSSGYVADSDPEEGPEEDSKDGSVDYPVDGADENDDDSSDNNEDEESSEEEEEHMAPTDSIVAPVIDHVPSSDETDSFKTDESAATPSSLHLPPHVSTSLPLPSSLLPPLPVLLFIPLLVDCREDIPEAKLPPRERLCLSALTSRYQVGESSTAAPRPTGGHRADYRFISTMDAKIRRQRAEEVGYGIRDVSVDLVEAVEELAPTLEGVNAKVTELATVQEQDTQDIYVVIEDA